MIVAKLGMLIVQAESPPRERKREEQRGRSQERARYPLPLIHPSPKRHSKTRTIPPTTSNHLPLLTRTYDRVHQISSSSLDKTAQTSLSPLLLYHPLSFPGPPSSSTHPLPQYRNHAISPAILNPRKRCGSKVRTSCVLRYGTGGWACTRMLLLLLLQRFLTADNEKTPVAVYILLSTLLFS